MSRLKSIIGWCWALVTRASYNRWFSRSTPRLVNETPPSFGKNSALAAETPAEHVRNAISILLLTGTHVIDRATDGSVVIVPLNDWNAALARLARAVRELEPPRQLIDGRPRSAAENDALLENFLPVSQHTPRPTRNVTTRERLAELESDAAAEWRRTLYGPQLS